jgi:3-deoxy-7-phosphoheptulonate synthase
VQRREPRDDPGDGAHAVKEAGATVLRGGAFKPRSSPYSFQGLGEEGLKYLAEAREQTGLPIITEVMSTEDVELVGDYTDIFQVGARNTQNYSLLKALGKQRKPVFLKRGISGTIQELLMSAEYILAGGNMQVMLCERGIRTYETATRNTFDINAIPVLKEFLSHLPVVADPAHGTGMWQYVSAGRQSCGGGWRRRVDDRSASRPGPRLERWRAEPDPEALHEADGGIAAGGAGNRKKALRVEIRRLGN